MTGTCQECGAGLTLRSYSWAQVPPSNTVKCFRCGAVFPIKAGAYHLSIVVGAALALPVSGALLETALDVADRLHSAPLWLGIEVLGVGLFFASFLLISSAVQVLMLRKYLTD